MDAEHARTGPGSDPDSGAPTTESAWRPRLRSLFDGLLIVFGAFFAASLAVIAVGGSLVNAGLLADGGTATQLFQTALQFAVFMLVVAWAIRATDSRGLIPFRAPTRRETAIVAVGVVALFLLQLLLGVALSSVGISTGENQAIAADGRSATYFLLMVPISLLFVGPAEELLFRGYLQGRLRGAWGAWPAILLATLIFGLIHIPAVSGSLGQQFTYALIAGALGIGLGYIYEYTKNIVVPAVIHGGYNATLFFIQYLAVAGVIG
ncbi:lysostaphin resistance A-like protein [Haloferacaceae archaeon DSL9]